MVQLLLGLHYIGMINWVFHMVELCPKFDWFYMTHPKPHGCLSGMANLRLLGLACPILKSVVVVQLLNLVQLFAPPWTTAVQASLFFTVSQSLLKLMSIESVIPSSHPILCHHLLLLPSVFPSIMVFSNGCSHQVAKVHIRWPKYWSFSFSISPSSECSELISFRIDWFYLLAIHQTIKRIVIVVQLLSHFATPWTVVHQASLFFTISWSFLKFMSIKYNPHFKQRYRLIPRSWTKPRLLFGVKVFTTPFPV